MRFERNIVFWIAALAILIGLLWLLSPILLPFVLGIAIAYALDPLAHRLTKRGMSRLVAALVILGGFVTALTLLVLLIAPVLAQQFSAFIDNAPAYALRLQAMVSDPAHPWIKRVIGDNLFGSGKSVGDLTNQAMGYLTAVLASLWTKGQALISIFSVVIITPVVAFYLICDWDRMIMSIDHLVPLTQRETVRRLGREIDATISAYVHGQSSVCLILGSYYAVGTDAGRIELRLADRGHFGADQLHSLCRFTDRARAVARRRFGAISSGLGPDRDRRRNRCVRPVHGRQCAGAKASRQKCRIASGVADVRAVCVRLSVRLCRAVAGGAFGRCLWRPHSLRAGALSCKSALYRQSAAVSGQCIVRWPVDRQGMSSHATASDKMSSRPRQLALALDHPESFAREDFLPGPGNEAALALIDAWPDWPSRAVALIGPEGSGKSHLANVWAAAAGARTVSAINIGAFEVPAMLATGALVIEDAGSGIDERALFHLINLAREEQVFLLFTARTAPSAWQISTPDVVSRLRAIPTALLQAPDDAMLRGVMVKLAADRQLILDDSLVSYIASRIERSFAAARSAVIALDQEALRQSRPPSRALAAELFRDRG